HSLSPAMHNAAFEALGLNYVYVPFAVPPDKIGTAIQSLASLGVVGVNLTIPHKELVLPYIDELTQEAKDVQAVNTVHVTEGRLLGDNTDGHGFWEPLREQGFSLAGETVFVLGAGGAARSVVFRLLREEAKVVLVNRTRERAERLAQDAMSIGLGEITTLPSDDTAALEKALRRSKLFVQTTRVGMYPHRELLPEVPLSALHSDLTVYDLVYNPVQTRLLAEAEARGCATMTGVKMLVYQGAMAFQRWTGVFPPTDVMEQAVLRGLNASKKE
ncbi:MAG: shikimate dehydrogenase, partial [Armatimonadetes bacterium]|nr:shikimate dehydrogenase [Armatimonadota bacterium]